MVSSVKIDSEGKIKGNNPETLVLFVYRHANIRHANIIIRIIKYT